MNNRLLQYPFTAIVGQELMKKALILNIINPGIGGVLIRGEKGTAKSTAVRALSAMLPEREVIKGCPFHCLIQPDTQLCETCKEKLAAGNDLETVREKMHVVDLPISATEDRVVGSLDIEHTLKTGEKRFEPGVLAQANGNILYVDEVNLLDDHIVDLLLDAAAMGINIVEREGVSFSHPAQFILVGTMNPEEGDIRPQLLDRFGLTVEVRGEMEIENRVEVIKRRLLFESNPEELHKEFASKQCSLVDKIENAKKMLPEIQLDESFYRMVARVVVAFEVDGHRADITLIKAAITLAAFNGRISVVQEDIEEAMELSLPHRMRRHPFEEVRLDRKKMAEIINQV